MREVIGKKSRGTLILKLCSSIFILILFLGVLIFFTILAVTGENNYNPLILLACFTPFIITPLVFLIIALRILKYPKDLIIVEARKIIFAKPYKEIEFQNILRIVGREKYALRGHLIDVKHGAIIIYTKDGQIYKQKYLDKVHIVANTLNLMLKKIKEENIHG